MDIPAICKRCGHRFVDRGFIGGSGGAGYLLVENCGTQCPRCGGEAELASFVTDGRGNVQWLQGAYDILRRAQLSRAEVDQLRAALDDARRQQASSEQVTAEIARMSPELAAFLRRYIIPDNPGATWAMLGVLVALLIWFAPTCQNPPAVVPPQVINNVSQVTNVYPPSVGTAEGDVQCTLGVRPRSPGGPSDAEAEARIARAEAKRLRRAQRRRASRG